MHRLQSDWCLSHRKIETGNTERRNISLKWNNMNRYFPELDWHKNCICANEICFWDRLETHCQYFSIQKIELPHIKSFINTGDRNRIKWNNAGSNIVDQGTNNKKCLIQSGTLLLFNYWEGNLSSCSNFITVWQRGQFGNEEIIQNLFFLPNKVV